ncbi:MAG: hypothetical protein IPF42_06325 [Candidatus Microthrix sp.]|nr:hypothetical protein [Candidatus Microthrix sp.]
MAAGDTGMQTGRRSIGHTMGFELFDDHSVEELAGRAAERPHQAGRPPGPQGHPPGVVIGKGGGGVLFHEACGHGLEADHIHKERPVLCRRVGEQVASPLVTLVDDGTIGGSGAPSRSTTRAGLPSATCSSRTACSPTTCGTTSGPARRSPQLGQRPPPELPAPAHGADDQHLPGRWRLRSGRHQPAPRPGCTWPTSAAVRSTRPRGTSSSG